MTKKHIPAHDEAFTGFTDDTFAFFEALAANNSKPWFEEHRDEYRGSVLEPLQALVRGLGDAMLAIDPHFETTPMVGKTISRIHRDTRFSRDKSPYRPSAWLTFKRPSRQWQGAPAYYFEITRESYRWGMGFYQAERPTMDNLRQIIDRRPAALRAALACLGTGSPFAVAGEDYKRIINPATPPDLMAWHQKKSVYLMAERDNDRRLFSKKIMADLARDFTRIAPLYRLFMELI